MKRLTSDTLLSKRALNNRVHPQQFDDVVERLAEYKDTELEPKEISILKERLERPVKLPWCGEIDDIIKQLKDVTVVEKQIPYKLQEQDGDMGLCKCGMLTEIIDEPFYCKYCRQKLCK